MVQSIQSFSPPPFQGGGFNPPGTLQNQPAGATNAFAAVGQNATMNGTNPTTQFNNTAMNALQMYANMGFDKNTQALLGVANNFLDPMKTASTLGFQPQTMSTDKYGFAQVSTMSSMTIGIALIGARTALQPDPTTGKARDPKGFITTMQAILKDPTALLNPEVQELAQQYQKVVGELGSQAAAITGSMEGVSVAQTTQMAELTKQFEELKKSQDTKQKAILDILTATEGKDMTTDELRNKLKEALQATSATAPATTAPTTAPTTTTPTTQQTYNKLVSDRLKPKVS